MSSEPQDIGAGPAVICYDGSEDSRRAIQEAGRLFGGKPVVVLHAGTAGPALPNVEVDEGALREAGERIAEEGAGLASEAGLEPSAVAILARGPVREAILQALQERDPVCVVVGARGLSGFKSLLLGSVSHYLVHHSSRPVLVVPAPRPPANAGPLGHTDR